MDGGGDGFLEEVGGAGLDGGAGGRGGVDGGEEGGVVGEWREERKGLEWRARR